MSKRRAADRARATENGNVGGMAAGRAGGGIARMTGSSGKTLSQLQAEQMAEARFTEMMAAAGVSSRTMMAELLYWIPDTFRDAYIGMTVQALRGTDGGTEDRNRAGDQTAAVGKAARKTTGGQSKKYKKFWVVQDEDLLELKSRMDKRLRGMAREIMEVLEQKEYFARLHREWASSEAIKNEDERKAVQDRLRREARESRRGRRMMTCACGLIISATWKFCPHCGTRQEIAGARPTDRSSKSK